jgi:hypothetical protein
MTLSSVASSELAADGKTPLPAVAIVAVWFGALPRYFQLWLDSCGFNGGFDWVVFTDADVSPYAVPANVGIRKMTARAFAERMGAVLGFPVVLGSPGKVCDFRPLFWALLSDEARCYAFWGHCDLDMIFGRLDGFITRDLLAAHDKIFSVGHLTLYRNGEPANQMFRRPHREVDWRAILADPRHHGFDEHLGVNRIWRAHGGRVFEDESLIADIDPALARFERAAPGRNHRRQLFYFDRGRVFRGYAQGSQWRVEEFMYIHFQKRPMTAMPRPGATRYAIAPGGFFDLPEDVAWDDLADTLNPRSFRWVEMRHRGRCGLRRLRRRLLALPSRLGHTGER